MLICYKLVTKYIELTMSREEKLRGLIEDIAKENKYDNCTITVEPISSGGANYTSHLYLSTLSAPGKDDLHLFTKVSATGKEIRETVPSAAITGEHEVYKHLINTYKQIEEKHNIKEEDRLLTPKYYAASSEFLHETLVLENLTKRGFESFNRFESVDWAYAAFSIKQLAIFHALSVVYKKEDKKGYQHFMESAIVPIQVEIAETLMTVDIDKSISAIKDENKERVAKFFSRVVDEKPIIQWLTAPGPVLTHGDFRPNNMMHKRHSDGSIEVIVLDYQTVRKGTPAMDLLYFIFLSTDKRFRDQYLQKCIDLYFNELSSALRRFGLVPSEIYTRSAYEEDITRCMPCILHMTFYLLLVITVEVNEAPEISADLGLLKTDIRPNKLYIERINDLVDDCIAMGVL